MIKEYGQVRVIQPPSFLVSPSIRHSVFLGGSIEMGEAEKWQDRFIEKLAEKLKKSGTGRVFDVYNPRRDDWDSSWVQSIENPQFYQQVTWELTEIKRCDTRVFYFAPETISPVTMLKFGDSWNMERTYLCAHPDYLRYGNLQIFAYMRKLHIYKNLDEVIQKIMFSV